MVMESQQVLFYLRTSSKLLRKITNSLRILRREQFTHQSQNTYSPKYYLHNSHHF